MAKKNKSKAHKHRNKILGVLIVALVLILFYVFSQQKSGTERVVDWEEETYTQEMEASSGIIDEITGLEVVGQSYFGYMKPEYILNLNIDSKIRRIQMRSLNSDGTVDLVLDRSYNLAVGETVYSDYNHDGVAELSVTLEGVVQVENRFSITITYYGVAPTAVTEKIPPYPVE